MKNKAIQLSYKNLLAARDKAFGAKNNVEYNNICQQIDGFIEYHAVFNGLSFCEAENQLNESL